MYVPDCAHPFLKLLHGLNLAPLDNIYIGLFTVSSAELHSNTYTRQVSLTILGTDKDPTDLSDQISKGTRTP